MLLIARATARAHLTSSGTFVISSVELLELDHMEDSLRESDLLFLRASTMAVSICGLRCANVSDFFNSENPCCSHGLSNKIDHGAALRLNNALHVASHSLSSL